MFTATQLQAAIDGIPQQQAVTDCGCGVIYLTSYDVDHVELSCAYAGDQFGGPESIIIDLYDDQELLEEINDWATECADELNRELANA